MAESNDQLRGDIALNSTRAYLADDILFQERLLRALRRMKESFRDILAPPCDEDWIDKGVEYWNNVSGAPEFLRTWLDAGDAPVFCSVTIFTGGRRPTVHLPVPYDIFGDLTFPDSFHAFRHRIVFDVMAPHVETAAAGLEEGDHERAWLDFKRAFCHAILNTCDVTRVWDEPPEGLIAFAHGLVREAERDAVAVYVPDVRSDAVSPRPCEPRSVGAEEETALGMASVLYVPLWHRDPSHPFAPVSVELPASPSRETSDRAAEGSDSERQRSFSRCCLALWSPIPHLWDHLLPSGDRLHSERRERAAESSPSLKVVNRLGKGGGVLVLEEQPEGTPILPSVAREQGEVNLYFLASEFSKERKVRATQDNQFFWLLDAFWSKLRTGGDKTDGDKTDGDNFDLAAAFRKRVLHGMEFITQPSQRSGHSADQGLCAKGLVQLLLEDPYGVIGQVIQQPRWAGRPSRYKKARFVLEVSHENDPVEDVPFQERSQIVNACPPTLFTDLSRDAALSLMKEVHTNISEYWRDLATVTVRFTQRFVVFVLTGRLERPQYPSQDPIDPVKQSKVEEESRVFERYYAVRRGLIQPHPSDEGAHGMGLALHSIATSRLGVYSNVTWNIAGTGATVTLGVPLVGERSQNGA